MPCFVDAYRTGKDKGEIYPTCCLDYKKPDECSYAEELANAGIWSSESCLYWRVDGPIKCKCCGQILPHNAKVSGVPPQD